MRLPANADICLDFLACPWGVSPLRITRKCSANTVLSFQSLIILLQFLFSHMVCNNLCSACHPAPSPSCVHLFSMESSKNEALMTSWRHYLLVLFASLLSFGFRVCTSSRNCCILLQSKYISWCNSDVAMARDAWLESHS